MASDSELLTSVESAISSRLAGETVDELQIGEERLRFPSLRQLYEVRDDLKRRIAADGSGSFGFGVPLMGEL